MSKTHGWDNYNTWNVAMHIGACEILYWAARDMADDGHSYKEFAQMLIDSGLTRTDDGVPWLDPSLDYKSLNNMMRELATPEN